MTGMLARPVTAPSAVCLLASVRRVFGLRVLIQHHDLRSVVLNGLKIASVEFLPDAGWIILHRQDFELLLANHGTSDARQHYVSKGVGTH